MDPPLQSQMNIVIVKNDLVFSVVLDLGNFDEGVMVQRIHELDHFLYDLSLLRRVVGQSLSDQGLITLVADFPQFSKRIKLMHFDDGVWHFGFLFKCQKNYLINTALQLFELNNNNLPYWRLKNIIYSSHGHWNMLSDLCLKNIFLEIQVDTSMNLVTLLIILI